MTVYGDVPYGVPVYDDFLIGHEVDYSPKVSSTTLDTYQVPKVHFEHDIEVGSSMRDGLVTGLVGGAVISVGITGAAALAGRRRGDSDDPDDPSTPPSVNLQSQSIDPRWQVVTPNRISESDADLDEMLGPFTWHAHRDTASGEQYWDYHRVPEHTWHQHRATVSDQLLVAEREHEELVGDNWIAFKKDNFPQAYLDPKFRYYSATDPEAGELIFFDMNSMANVMERKGGPHEPHPNIDGIADNHASVSVKHNGY